MLFATSCNKGSAIYYWLCSKTLGATLWRLRRLRTIKAQCSPPLLHARRRVCCCLLVGVHAPVAPTGRLDRLPALPISNLAYVRFSSLKVRFLGLIFFFLAAVVFYTLADGFAAACRSACMHRLPAVPGTQFMYDFLVCKSYLQEAQHCVTSKGNLR